MADIKTLRTQIDTIDFEILSLLKKRFDLLVQVADYKQKNRLPIYQEGRESEIMENRSEAALKLGLSPLFVVELFRIILRESKQIQQLLLHE